MPARVFSMEVLCTFLLGAFCGCLFGVMIGLIGNDSRNNHR